MNASVSSGDHTETEVNCTWQHDDAKKLSKGQRGISLLLDIHYLIQDTQFRQSGIAARNRLVDEDGVSYIVVSSRFIAVGV